MEVRVSLSEFQDCHYRAQHLTDQSLHWPDGRHVLQHNGNCVGKWGANSMQLKGSKGSQKIIAMFGYKGL